MLLRVLKTLLLGGAGGWLFFVWNSPLPWLLGALVTTVISIFLGVKNLWLPRSFRNIGLVVIGISLGLHMTTDIWQTMTDHLGLMLIATCMTVLIGLGNAWLLHKVGKVDGITSVFSNIPGGLSEMVAVGQSLGGNQQIITIFHSIRAVAVVLCVPFIVTWLPQPSGTAAWTPGMGQVLGGGQTLLIVAIGLIGAYMATRFSIPAPFLLGALLCTALVSLNTSWMGVNPELSSFLVIGAQILIGVSIGLGFRREDIRDHRRFFLLGLMQAMLLLLLVLLLAFSMTYLTENGMVTNLLAVAPGGIAEMSLTAMTMEADPLLVSSFQLFRVLFVLSLFSLGVRAWLKRHPEMMEAANKSA